MYCLNTKIIIKRKQICGRKNGLIRIYDYYLSKCTCRWLATTQKTYNPSPPTSTTATYNNDSSDSSLEEFLFTELALSSFIPRCHCSSQCRCSSLKCNCLDFLHHLSFVTNRAKFYHDMKSWQTWFIATNTLYSLSFQYPQAFAYQYLQNQWHLGWQSSDLVFSNKLLKPTDWAP